MSISSPRLKSNVLTISPKRRTKPREEPTIVVALESQISKLALKDLLEEPQQEQDDDSSEEEHDIGLAEVQANEIKFPKIGAKQLANSQLISVVLKERLFEQAVQESEQVEKYEVLE
jgi:hypothetical protein